MRDGYILLPDELLVRVSTFLDLSAILAFCAASKCLVNLTPIMLERDPTMALVHHGEAKAADAIIRAHKHLNSSTTLNMEIDADCFVQLLYGVFTVSPPMALHLVGLVGLFANAIVALCQQPHMDAMLFENLV
ncbi:hypothetical protein BC828DRAFT_417222 [Blastocladiella britannica]|nr:hypothetical protein BC828DRAFT_417222 [Blastocladiella britannica]